MLCSIGLILLQEIPFEEFRLIFRHFATGSQNKKNMGVSAFEGVLRDIKSIMIAKKRNIRISEL